MTDANNDMLKTVIDSCKNIASLKLQYFAESEMPSLHGPQNLKVLKVMDVRISNAELRNCFKTNKDLEYFEYSKYRNTPLEIESLHLLPKLNSLCLHQDIYDLRDFDKLLTLDGLTKFIFLSWHNCNQLMIKLAQNLDLVALKCRLPYTFDIIQSFQKLELLSMHHSIVNLGCSDEVFFLTTPVFPSKLKSIDIDFRMSCSTLLEIIKQLEFFEEFKLFFGGYIFSDLDRCELFLNKVMLFKRHVTFQYFS